MRCLDALSNKAPDSEKLRNQPLHQLRRVHAGEAEVEALEAVAELVVIEAEEVQEAFDLPFAHVADPARYRIERRRWRGGWRSYHAAPFGPYYLWGATARILLGLARRL